MVRHLSFALLALAFIAAMLAGSAAAADPACKPVFDAMTKMAATPNHQFMGESAAYDAGAKGGEVITTSNAVYVKVKGTWRKRPYDPQQQVTELREAYKSASMACQHVRDEAVAGESVALYDTQNKQEGGDTVNSQFWISRARGLPVKQTMDIDVGGKLGKSHTDVRIDYENVQAPAGVK